jgi:2-oxoglutarate dehydrogenase E2 component (dihydrolipoamide succinyltransferase)
MIIEVIVPGAGESVTEAAIGNWLVADGSYVEKDQEIAEVETDKATLTLVAPEAGKIKIVSPTAQKAKVGDIACTIDTEAVNTGKQKGIAKKAMDIVKQKDQPEGKSIRVTPLAHKIMIQNNLDVEDVIDGLKKISRHDVEKVLEDRTENHFSGTPEKNSPMEAPILNRGIQRTPMSPLRRKLSKRLVAVKNETAMLTTFNEVDMSSLMYLRKKYQLAFTEKHRQKLGLMSFFALACAKTLLRFPVVNSFLEGEEIVTPSYVDISLAVQTDKGLMAPVIRNAHLMNIPMLEIAIAEMAAKARKGKLSIDDMEGGTFTITNGGVFGSMLSTPILNPPQSAILGMHNIVDRPVAVDGKVEIRPIMYVALSYDHRLIDGRDSVGFLYQIKEMLETPYKILIEGRDPYLQLLNI